MANVNVTRSGSENTPALMRRFTKRVQSAGIVKKVRGIRYYDRATSKTMRRKSALKMIEKRAAIEVLAKAGKLPDTPQKGRRR